MKLAHTSRLGWYTIWLTRGMLLCILLIAGYFRTLGLFTWDGGTEQHPDERSFARVASHIRIPSSFGEYFNLAHAPTNPRDLSSDDQGRYDGSSLPLLLTRLVAVMLTPNDTLSSQEVTDETWLPRLPPSLQRIFNPQSEDLTTATNIYRVSRSLNVLVDLLSIALVYLVGKRLSNRPTGLLAALLSAATVLHIQHTHFFIDPIFATCFTLLALYWAVRVAQEGKTLSFIALGASIGLAVAIRIPPTTLAGVALVALVLAFGAWKKQCAPPLSHWLWLRVLLNRGLPMLLLSGVCAFATFFLAQPDGSIGSLPNTQVDIPTSFSWVNRTPYLYPLKNLILWGMGPLLGVAAWLGWVLAGISLIVQPKRLNYEQEDQCPIAWLILWVWVGWYFLWRGWSLVVDMRSMLPISGALTIFAARLLIGKLSWRHGNAERPKEGVREENVVSDLQKIRIPVPLWFHTFQYVLLAVVVVGTYAWAYGFTRIYTRPHTRVTAAQWLLQHAPPNTKVLYEWWNDPLPFDKVVTLPWLNRLQSKQIDTLAADTPEKFLGGDGQQGLFDMLADADVLTLTSNRVYGSIQQLPMRYPVTMRFYQVLFNGDLGYELIADITSSPSILGFSIPDQHAEESFSIYDHPRVFIFRKTGQFSRSHAEQILTDQANWDEVYTIPIKATDQATTALRITESQWPTYRAGGTWSTMFHQDSLVNWIAPVVWFFVLELLGLATFAILFRLFPHLPDGGWSLARPAGLLMVAFGAWWLGSLRLLPFSTESVWFCAAPLLIIGTWVAIRSIDALAAFWHRRCTALLMAEGIYVLAFILFLIIRWLNPDLWQPWRGGEKPMEFAYLNAILKSAAFPPYDPWFAGGYINYYYFGYVIVGTLIHLTTIVPTIAFNLAIPTLFALTALASWGGVYNLLAPMQKESKERGYLNCFGADVVSGVSQSKHEHRARLSAVLAPILLLLTGNLAQAVWYITGYATKQAHRPEWAFWDATRIVEGTVNEFPFFTFLFADLHPHMMVMPFALSLLILTVVLVRSQEQRNQTFIPLIEQKSAWIVLVLMGVLVGTLRVTNTWDYPTYGGLAIVTVIVVHIQSVRQQWRNSNISPFRHVLSLLLSVVVIFGVGHIAFLPFSTNFATESSGIEWLPTHINRTTLAELLRMNGLWLFFITTAGLMFLMRAMRLSKAFAVLLLIPVVAAVLFFAANGYHVPVLVAPLLVSAGMLVWSLRRQPLRVVLPLWWAIFALGICLGVEIVVVRGDVGRMNTVFKFGLHAWTLFALTTAVLLPWMWKHNFWIWRIAALLLCAASFVYPITATPSRIADRYTDNLPHTLDGAAFMRFVNGNENDHPFPLREDDDAIVWIQNHVRGTPILLEAHQPSYRWGGRIATFTGLPTLFGWEWHQIQQRSVVNTRPFIDWLDRNHHPKDMRPVLERRILIVEQIFNTTDLVLKQKLITQYGIEYIYRGGVEQAIYQPDGLAAFDKLVQQGYLQSVFQSGNATIYQVVYPGQPTMLTPDSPLQLPTKKGTPPPLVLTQPVATLPIIQEYAWNNWANNNAWVAIMVWLIAIYTLAFIGFPLSFVIFHRWSDGGVSWAKLIGLILTGYVVWLPTSLQIWTYSLWSLSAGIILILALDVAIIVRLRRNISTYLWVCRRNIVIGEIVFLAGFAFFTLVRAYNPDLWHPIWGGEKPMETGFLNAMLRSPVMPPYTPFFSDGYINYYYYGFFLVSLPIKASGIDPAIAFNLVIPTLFALTLAGAYAIVAQLTNHIRYGLAGSAFVALFGNLATVIKTGWSQGFEPVQRVLFDPQYGTTFWQRYRQLGQRIGDWYIGPSRIIVKPFTINEFPYWSFLYADLHPHLMALPIVLLAIALAYQLLLAQQPRLKSHDHKGVVEILLVGHRGSFVALILLAALTLGALAVTNSWDFPTYALLIGAVLIGRAWRANDCCHILHKFAAIGGAALLTIILAITAMGLYAPFFDAYYAFVSGIGTVKDYSNIQDYIVIYGLFLAILVPVFFGTAWRVMGAAAWREKERATHICQQLPDPVLSKPAIPTLPRWLNYAGPLLLFAPFLFALTTVVVSIIRNLLLLRLSRLASLVYLLTNSLFFVSLVSVIPPLKQYLKKPDTVQFRTPPLPPLPAVVYQPEKRIRNDVSQVGKLLSIIGRVSLLLTIFVLVRLATQDPSLGLRLWLGTLLLVGTGLLISRRLAPTTWFVLLLATLAWAVSLGMEFIFIKDHLAGGEAYRMNTVFKFGFQTWVLLALASAASLPQVLHGLHRFGRKLATFLASAVETTLNVHDQRIFGVVMQIIGSLALTPLIIVAAMFPLIGTPSRVANRFAGSTELTLDGLAFMQYGTFFYEQAIVNLQPDGEAIAWLKQHISGTPIVVQSGQWFYRAYGIRIAANTGLPTVVSSLHESEQRDPSLVGIRDGDVETLYRTTDADEALRILATYRVNYVYVGSLEHAFYPAEGIEKFQTTMAPFLDTVYNQGEVQIYHVRLDYRH